MPRIRQAIALLVAVAGCIGFNTFRYPVVREMAAVISAVGPSAAAKTGENPAPPTKDARRAGSTEKPAKDPPANVVCRDGVCTFASPDSATASIHSSHLGDSATDTLRDASAKTASSANPESELESTSKPWGYSGSEPPADGATASESWPMEGSDGNLPGRGESKSIGEESRGSPLESAAGTRESESTATSEGRSEAAAGTGTIAKFVSALVSGKSPPSVSGDSSLGESSLVPIQRPKSRAPKSKASPRVSSSAGVKSSAEPSATDKTVRHLPPVDLASTADFLAAPPTLSPEQIRDYAVTPIK